MGPFAGCLLASIAACEDSSNPSVSAPTFDAGLPDAAQPTLDAAAPDAAEAGAPAKVTVTALSRSFEAAPQVPREGVQLFGVSGNALVSTATTGPDGTASLDLPNGGSVTAVYPLYTMDGKYQGVTTFAGVKPGDKLTFGDHAPEPQVSGIGGTLTVSWAPVDGATGYEVLTPCGGSGVTSDQVASIPLYPYCQTATAPVGLIAYNGEQIVSSAYIAAAPFTDGTTLTIDGAKWVAQANPNVTVTITGIPSSFLGADLYAYGDFGRGGYVSVNAHATLAGDTISQGFSVPATAPKKYVDARITHDNANLGRYRFWSNAASPTATAVGHPWVDSRSYENGLLKWTLAGTGTYDAVTLSVHWYTDDKQTLWRLILPPDTKQLDVSALPAELKTALAVPESPQIGLLLVDLASTASYDAARALPEWRLFDPSSAVARGDEPSTFAADGGEGFSDFY